SSSPYASSLLRCSAARSTMRAIICSRGEGWCSPSAGVSATGAASIEPVAGISISVVSLILVLYGVLPLDRRSRRASLGVNKCESLFHRHQAKHLRLERHHR